MFQRVILKGALLLILRGIMANFFGINCKLVVQVGSWIFVHAGLTMNMYSNVNICKINNAISNI